MTFRTRVFSFYDFPVTKTTDRSIRPEVFYKEGVLKDFAKFTGKHLCQRLFFNKVAGLRPAILLKKKLWHRCFPVNFSKFLRSPFFIEHLQWLLLIRLRGNIFKSISNYSIWKEIRLLEQWESSGKRRINPAGNYMLKVNNRITRTRREICLKLTIKSPEQDSIAFSMNFMKFFKVAIP